MKISSMTLVRNVRTLQKNLDKLSALYLELLAHPEATMEQVQEVRESLMRVEERVRHLNQVIREKNIYIPGLSGKIELHLVQKGDNS